MNKVKDAKVHDVDMKITEVKLKRASIRKIFQYADTNDYILMSIGALHAAAAGAGIPGMIVLFGKMMDSLGMGGKDFMSMVNVLCVEFLYVAAGMFYCVAVHSICWTLVGDNQALKIREVYIKSVLRQDIQWFDENKVTELPTRIISATAQIQEGLGKRIGDAIQFLAQFVGLYVVGFFFCWKLSLVIMAGFPVILGSVTFLQKVIKEKEGSDDRHYAAAGGIAVEVLSAMRTVVSLNGEQHEISRYDERLHTAEGSAAKMAFQMGVGNGGMFGAMFALYGLGWWYGSQVVASAMEANCNGDNCMTGGKVVTVFFAVLMGSMAIGQAGPSIQALATALEAAGRIFDTIERVPKIDAMSSEGSTNDFVEGALTFENIVFAYPTRLENVVYQDLSLKIKPGENVALVGPSGEGKSTLISLVLRFYDPQGGTVRFDGQDIRTLNLQWYRMQLGYVGQEPVLFAGSIRENIRSGRPSAMDSEIEEATKAANAHNFICSFPKGYDTQVGEAGVQLSGGQKQRVAIARAIIKKPKVLLLDEATSALDNESERVVQEALDTIQQTFRFTVIVIAHRLTTIQNCDQIAVISKGKVAEIGTHAALSAKVNGVYASLSTAGAVNAKKDESSQIWNLNDCSEEIKQDQEPSIIQTLPQKLLASTSQSSKNDTAKGDIESAKTKQNQVGLLRLMSYVTDQWFAMFLGLLGCVIVGSTFPVQGLILARAQTMFYQPRPRDVIRDGAKWAVAYLILAIVMLLGSIFRSTGLGIYGARLTTRIRSVCFQAIIAKPIWWFDKDEHAAGSLVENLSADACKIQNMVGGSLGSSINMLSSLVIGLAFSFYYCWQMALAVFAVLPFFSIAGFIQMKLMSGTAVDKGGMDGGDEAGATITSAIQGIRTIHAFCMQTRISDEYETSLRKVQAERGKKTYIAGLVMGYAMATGFVAYSFLFYIGGELIKQKKCTFTEMMTSLFSLVTVAFSFGDSAMLAGDQQESKNASARIFGIVDEKDTSGVDSFSDKGDKLPNPMGDLEFRDIKFAYPSRPDMVIYNNFNLKVPNGSTVALCGPSGGGKSTVMALLLRFYLPLEGTILFDGKDIRDLNLKWLRSQIGYVSQEPVLFSGSIRSNIKYGNPHATEQEMIGASTIAKAHEFVSTFQLQYETDVGEKSILLSGGQKQRLAIARAILKNPKVLLLDEATSALDNENEKLVQEALDNMQAHQKRTTLVIAHRLSTIQNADAIAVINMGKVVEIGTHNQLLNNQGLYSKLCKTPNPQ